jgi:hypothetical protein
MPRSMAKLASVTRNEQRYATPPGALFVKNASTSAKATGTCVAAGDDAEHAGGILRRVGGRVEGAVIRRGRHLERGQPAVAVGADLHVHVVVAREAGADVRFSVRDSIHFTGRPILSAPTMAHT